MTVSYSGQKKRRKKKCEISSQWHFKDQGAANAVRQQLHDLGHKIGPTLQPVFVSKKLGQNLKPKEIKPSIVIKQCMLTIFRVICAMQIMSGTQPYTGDGQNTDPQSMDYPKMDYP